MIFHNYSTEYTDYPWPRKNSQNLTNDKLISIPIKYNGEIVYFNTLPGKLCFYNKSPCTHKQNLKIKKETVFKLYRKYKVDNN